MTKYKAYIPKWEIEVEAESKREALEIAGEIYDDHRSQDDLMGAIVVEQM